MVKITLEYSSIDLAIVALGKLVGARAAPQAAGASPPVTAAPTTRKGRADKGVKRGSHKDAGAQTVAADIPPVAAPQEAFQPSPVSVAPAPSGADVIKSEILAQQKAHETPSKKPPVPSPADVQAAIEKLFETKKAQATMDVLSRYGVKRGRDLLEGQRAEFIAEVGKLVAAP